MTWWYAAPVREAAIRVEGTAGVVFRPLRAPATMRSGIAGRSPGAYFVTEVPLPSQRCWDRSASALSAFSTARAISTRELASSLRNMLRMCVSTVFVLRNSSLAISPLVLRSTMSRAISSSRAVSVRSRSHRGSRSRSAVDPTSQTAQFLLGLVAIAPGAAAIQSGAACSSSSTARSRSPRCPSARPATSRARLASTGAPTASARSAAPAPGRQPSAHRRRRGRPPRRPGRPWRWQARPAAVALDRAPAAGALGGVAVVMREPVPGHELEEVGLPGVGESVERVRACCRAGVRSRASALRR